MLQEIYITAHSAQHIIYKVSAENKIYVSLYASVAE